MCDEAAMAALRRVIASKQRTPSSQPSLLPQPQLAEQSSLDRQYPAAPSPKQATRGQQCNDTGSQLSASEQVQQTQSDHLFTSSAAEDARQQAQDAAWHSSTVESLRPESDGILVPDTTAVTAQTAADSPDVPQPLRAVPAASASSGQHTQSANQPEIVLSDNSGRQGYGALQVGLADFRVAETRVRPSAMREVALKV